MLRAVNTERFSIFFTPLSVGESPQQPAAGVLLPYSRLRLSSRSYHGDFATRACTFAHARGAALVGVRLQ